MLILAFDTTSEQGGAAIYRDQDCVAAEASQGPANFYSVTLFQTVGRLLRESKLALGDIDLFAVANGPGSFTGIRVGVAAAQGWAYALKRPVRGISVFEAMVEQARPEVDWAIPVLDARRREFFLGLFRRAGQAGENRFDPEGDGVVLKPEAVRRFLEEVESGERAGSKFCCIAREHDLVAQGLRERLPTSFAWQAVSGPLMGAMARLALRASREGMLQSPDELDACYIRRSDAELLFPRAQKQDQKV